MLVVFVNRVTQDHRDHARRCKRRGVDARKGGDLVAAMEHYQDGMAFDKKAEDGDLLHNAGVAMWGLGRLDEARDLFRRATESNPRDGRPHNNAGILSLEEGNLESALASFQRACELSEDDPGPALNVGVALLRLARDEEAEISLRASADKFPGHTGIREALALARRLLGEQEGGAESGTL